MEPVFVEPTTPLPSRAAVFLSYLDYFRSRLTDKVRRLGPGEAWRSRLPSGWTPAELMHHLRHVERRWLEWGFLGQDVEDPWADRVDDRWQVSPGLGLEELAAALQAQGERTTEIVQAAALDQIGCPGPRWEGAPPPTLERILLHLVQEYARHLGHLDVVSELAGAGVGE